MKKILLILILLTVIFNLTAKGNPFLNPNKKQESSKKENATTIQMPFLNKIVSIQKELNSKLSRTIRETKENPSFGTVFLALLIAFIYGIIHALGPGHGKVFATTYFISNKSNYIKGFILGFLTALIHASSAVLIVTTLYFILSNGSMKNIDQMNMTMQKVSYIVIIFVGLFLLIQALKHSHKEKKKEENRSLLSIAFAVGMVPCPGTTIILIFSMTLGVYFFGILLATTMALGMGITISLAGISAIFIKNQGKKINSTLFKNTQIFEKIFNIAGATIIMLLGIVLFIGTFLP